MMGTDTPCASRRSTICGTASAASSLFTVTRTSSLPAAASWATWVAVASTSAVSVLVMDWTTMGWAEPTGTGPTLVGTVRLRVIVLMRGLIYVGDEGGWRPVEGDGKRGHRPPSTSLPLHPPFYLMPCPS